MSPEVELLIFYFKRFRKLLYLRIFKRGLNGIMGIDFNLIGLMSSKIYTQTHSERRHCEDVPRRSAQA